MRVSLTETPERDDEVYGQVGQTRMAGCLPQRRSPAMQLGRWFDAHRRRYHHHLYIGGSLQPSGDNHLHQQANRCGLATPKNTIDENGSMNVDHVGEKSRS